MQILLFCLVNQCMLQNQHHSVCLNIPTSIKSVDEDHDQILQFMSRTTIIFNLFPFINLTQLTYINCINETWMIEAQTMMDSKQRTIGTRPVRVVVGYNILPTLYSQSENLQACADLLQGLGRV